jgi:type I restriction enzyme S subunit
MSEWKETELNKIGNVVSGGTPSTAVSEFWNGNILFVTPYDLSRNKSAYIENTERKISKEGLANSSANLLPSGSVVISSRAPIGYVAVAKKDFTTNQGCKSIIPNSNFDSLYLYYCLNFYVDRIKRLGAGSTFAEISKGDLELVKIPHPDNISEQRKIAQVLSKCDAVIEKTQATIRKYKAIKLGILHDLFTRGIDIRTGKLRPKYEDAPHMYYESGLGLIPRDWKVKDILGSTYIKGRIGWQGLRADEFIETGPFLVTGTDFINGKINWNLCYHVSETRFQEAPAIQISNGDVLITKDGTIGKIAYVLNCPQKAILNSGIFVMRCKDRSYGSQYFYHLLNSDIFHLWLRTYQGGSTINHLYQREFERFKFPIPNIEEQNAISERLNSLDQQINTEQVYLHKILDLKQGLMKDLLTGIKKVKIDEKES